VRVEPAGPAHAVGSAGSGPAAGAGLLG